MFFGIDSRNTRRGRGREKKGCVCALCYMFGPGQDKALPM
jgi:hypothetical protein